MGLSQAPDAPVVLVLYSEAMGYTYNVLRGVRETGAEVHLVYWDNETLTPYVPRETFGIVRYPRSRFDDAGLLALQRRLSPDIIVTSGWFDTGYVAATRRYAREQPGVAIVLALDTRFERTFRKLILGPLAFRLKYRQYTGVWAAGPPQFAYARYLGFSESEIAGGLLVGDATLMRPDLTAPPRRRFVYVGRLAPEKAPGLLIRAYGELPPSTRRAWPLEIYGDGPLRDELARISSEGVVFKGWTDGPTLGAALAEGGVLVVPSSSEAWGVIVHEGALAGLSLVLSDRVGASHTFLIPGYNGASFPHDSSRALLQILRGYCADGAERLARERDRSLGLAKRITTETSAHALLSLASTHWGASQRSTP